MNNKSQGELNFGKFPLNGVFLVMFFMIFLGGSVSPILDQELEIENFENQVAQFSAADSHKIPANGPDHFVKQIEEKEEEKREGTISDYSLDALGSSYGNLKLTYFLLPKASISPNFWITTCIPLYLLFHNLKLDFV